MNIEQKRLSSYSDRLSKLRERKSELTAQQLKVWFRTIRKVEMYSGFMGIIIITILQIVGGVQKRKTLTERLEELNLLLTSLQREVEQARAQSQPISEELEQEQKTLLTMRAKHRLMLEDKRKQVNW